MLQRLFLINIVGVVAAGLWAGYVWPAGHAAWLTVAAGILFGIAAMVPFWRQYRALSAGFDEIQATTVDTHRPRKKGEAEVFAPGVPEPSPVFKRARPGRRLAMALSIIAALLFVSDAGWYFATKPASPHQKGVIANF